MTIPSWIWTTVPVVALSALGVAYVAAPDREGRADECLGNTTPIQRGAMVNRCDHAISVLVCPQDATATNCVVHDVTAAASFEMRADIPVIAHACTGPYAAVMAGESGKGVRRCRAPE